MTLPMKRCVEVAELDTANTLMRLSEAAGGSGRNFACKTCNKEFPTFQALGGHRASHKRLKLDGLDEKASSKQSLPPKVKNHDCPMCGLSFPIGQALGGHMRRHRAELANKDGTRATIQPSYANSLTTSATHGSSSLETEVVKKPSCMLFGVDLMGFVKADERLLPSISLEIGITTR